MEKTNLHNDIFEKAIELLRDKYYRTDNATAIPRDDMHWTYYQFIVEECASHIDHIHVWDGNLGDHLRRKMGLL